MKAMTVIGVGACPGGWVGMELHDGRYADAHFEPRLDTLVRRGTDRHLVLKIALTVARALPPRPCVQYSGR